MVLRQDSNPQPIGRKSDALPPRHHDTCISVIMRGTSQEHSESANLRQGKSRLLSEFDGDFLVQFLWDLLSFFPRLWANLWKKFPWQSFGPASSETTWMPSTLLAWYTHELSTFIPHLIFRSFDWHRYSGSCSNERYLGHSKNRFTYLLTLRQFQSTLKTILFCSA